MLAFQPNSARVSAYSYNDGDINIYSVANGGYTYAGGIIGSGSIAYCYNTGNIIVEMRKEDS